MMQRLLADAEATDSALEAEVKRLAWAAGLPKPEVHFNVCSGNRWIANVDFAWPKIKLCIPANSVLYHSAKKRVYRDSEQISELIAAGWMPLPTTKRDVLHAPQRFIERLQATAKLAADRAEREGPGEGDAARMRKWRVR